MTGSSNASPSPGLDPALRFVIACCRWPDDAERRRQIDAAAARVGDWSAVEAAAQAHRVEGLVATGMSETTGAPMEILQWADRTREAFRAQALLEIGETLRVSEALTGAGIDLRVMKGMPLGVVAFGRAGVKRSWDIDVLVHPSDAVAAAAVVAGLGYAPTKPPRALDAAEFERWSVVSKHAGFHSPRGLDVEVHWRLTSLPGLLQGIDARSPARMVPLLGERAVPTLADAANLAYICVHGAAHGWSRLKWLADFSAFVSGRSEDELDSLIDQARSCRAGRAIAMAFAVRSELLGFPIPRSAAGGDRVAELARHAISVIASRGAHPIEGDRAAMRHVERICRSLSPEPGYLPAYLLKRYRGSEIRALVALPRGLQWAYWLIRPYSFLRRFALRYLGT